MKGAAGLRGARGFYKVIAKALAAVMPTIKIAPDIMDRPPGFMGVAAPANKCKRAYLRNNSKPAFQGAQERARRRAQLGLGEFGSKFYTA